MSFSHLDPLPSDYLNLISKSSVSHTTNLANVSTIIARLELAKSQLAGTAPPLPEGETDPAPSASDTLLPLSSFVKQANMNAGKESKEWGNAVNKFAKSVDKKFPGPPPPLFTSNPSHVPPPTLHPTLLSISPSGDLSSSIPTVSPLPPAPFSSPEEISALNETIATHLARIGAFSSLSTFLEESQTPSPISSELIENLKNLHSILRELESGVCQEAIEWVLSHPEQDPKGDLEFSLRKEEFIRILLGGTTTLNEPPSTDTEMEETEPLLASTSRTSTSTSTSTSKLKSLPPDPYSQAALAYGGTHFRHLLTPSRTSLICSLLTSPLYMPFPKLLSSPYGSLFSPYSTSSSLSPAPSPTSSLLASFSAAYLKSLGLPNQSPLTVVTDVGGSGAMAKIMKVRQVMKEKRTEWSAQGELPIEIPLPTGYRYHSIFACPVSKEQSTPSNPPMLLPCGHCIAKESLVRLARGTPTLKCPYCPIVSHVNACVRVHF
ncbi:hypothetical protein JCM5353_008134 [Sporobolomyces roseus]